MADQTAAKTTGKPSALAWALKKIALIDRAIRARTMAALLKRRYSASELARFFNVDAAELETVSERASVVSRRPEMARLFIASNFSLSMRELSCFLSARPKIEERIRRLDPKVLDEAPFL